MGTDALKTYEKYYDLEGYLFDKVGPSFHSRTPKCLTPFEFFAIAIWKANRNKSRIKKGFVEGTSNIDDVSAILASYDNNNAGSFEHVLSRLIETYGIGIPVASAFLTVLYPDDFTIVDIRTVYAFEHHDQLKTFYEKADCFKPNPSIHIEGYRKYLRACKDASTELRFENLRAFDQALWGYSFYEDLKTFVQDVPVSKCVYTG